MRKLLSWVLGFSIVALALRAEVSQLAGASQPAPNRIRPHLLVLPAGWTAGIPPTGRVNAPEFLSTLYPGQSIALGLLAEGRERDKLFDGVTVAVKFSPGAGSAGSSRPLKPVAVRRVKAEGADFALLALSAGGISEADRAKMEDATSLVTLAVFLPDWTVPADGAATEVEIALTVSGTAAPVKVEPVRLTIKPTAVSLAEPPMKPEEIGAQLNRFHSDLAPAQLLGWFRAIANSPALEQPGVQAFFVFAFKASPAARAAAVEAYASLDQRIQPRLLRILQLGGHNLTQLFPTLPAETLEPVQAAAPLPDPRTALPHFKDPVDPQAVAGVGNIMDQCWSGWMATGDASYLRALVGLLEGAADFPALQSWQKSRGGAKGLNAKVARGLAYQIAGWSIGSFQRTDPRVADWLSSWENDSAVSATIRREIASLPTNPAFRRK